MQISESLQEYETHKILWNFRMQTDHLIQTRRTRMVLVAKNK